MPAKRPYEHYTDYDLAELQRNLETAIESGTHSGEAFLMKQLALIDDELDYRVWAD